MKEKEDRSLLIGAILVGLIIAIATWFLGISPKLSGAQSAREETDSQNAANAGLQSTLDQRKADAAHVPDYTREIYTIRDTVPPIEGMDAVRRDFDAMAKESALTIQRDEQTDPVPVLGALSLAAAMDAVGLTSNIEGLTFTTLIATPFTIEVSGAVDNVYGFVDKLQTQTTRYILITQVNTAADPTKGPGVVVATIAGMYFTLDTGNAAITVRPTERPWPGAPEPSPSPSSATPFVPLVPSGLG